jgi:type II secretory pathway pseudopilin PulG
VLLVVVVVVMLVVASPLPSLLDIKPRAARKEKLSVRFSG